MHSESEHASSDAVSFTFNRDEIGSVILALSRGIENMETKTFIEDAERVQARLVKLLASCMERENQEKASGER